MKTPLIDAEAMGEFLDKAEPLLPEDFLRTLGERWKRLTDRLHGGGVAAEWPRLWDLTPATRRLAQPLRQTWQARAEELWPLVSAGTAEAALDRLASWGGETPLWLLDWATFWLHVADPERNPWWARWVYRPDGRTGALLLLLDEPDAFGGDGLGSTYQVMREALRFLAEVLASTRRLRATDETHRATVALASVYAVYMFTMAAWRMTTEFTQVLPPFPRVVSALVGIDRWEDSQLGGKGQTH